MRAHRVTLAAALAALACAGPLVAPVAAQPYPRLGLYGSVLGGGYPYTKPDFTLDTLQIRRAARYQQIVLDVYPISPYRPDIVQAMRAVNPNAKFLAYLLAEDIWLTGDADSLRHIPTVIRRTVRDLGGFLYDRNTGGEYSTIAINLAKKVNGRYVVAEAMANIMRDHIIATGLWDGIFTDIFCHTVSWTQNGTGRVIDLTRAGYASAAALDAAWAEAADTLAARLRRDGGPAFELVGNCGPSSEHAYYNGWMRENFPFQQGGSWASNMLGDVSSRGYLKDDRDYVQPPCNWILSASTTAPGSEYQSYNTNRVRFGLGSSTLGEGVHAFAPTKSVNEAPYHEWWYDEYGVDLATGRSSEAVEHTGWLGEALGPARTMVWVSTAPDAITNPDFESSVVTGWTFAQFAPAVASITRDASTAAVGSSSAKVHIATPSTVEWHVYLSSAGTLNVQAGTSYSATFRCKASGTRNLHVLAGNSGGQGYVTVDTTWRQYQVVMTPTVSMAASLSFFLGLEAGDVWFDDVHFQAGATSVWRRDFRNGIVLVNPTELSLDVQLEAPYRRLLGVRAPLVNDGTVSLGQRLGPSDALFLLRTEVDITPPAGVRDLRIGP